MSILMLAVAEWGITSALRISNPFENFGVLWFGAEILGASLAAVFHLLLILEYIRQNRVNYKLHRLVLFSGPLFFVLMAITNDIHHQFWTGYALDGNGMLHEAPGPLFIIFLLYYYGLRLVGTLLLLRIVLRISSKFRHHTLTIALGAFAPWLSNIIYAAVAPAEQFSTASLLFHPLAYAISGLILGWGMLYYHLFEVVPLARDIIIDNLQDAILILNSNNRIVDLNNSATSIFAIEAKKTFGKPVEQVFANHPELLSLISGQATTCEVCLSIPHERYFEAQITTIKDRRGQLRGRLLTLRDIHDRKHTEKALRESESNLSMVLEAAPFPMSITTLADGRIIYANPVALRTYEVEVEDVANWNSTALYDNPHQRELITEQLAKTGHIDGLELHLHTARGNKRWMIVSIRKLLYQGQECLLSAQVDISERKKVEEALAQSQAQLQVIFDYAGVGIQMVDRNGNYIFANEHLASMLGVSAEELKGQSDLAYLHPNDIHFNREMRHSLICGQVEKYHAENRYRRKNGDYFWGELTVTPTFDPIGEIDSVIGFIIDITKRKQAETALRETERRFREILENVHLLAVMLDTHGNITFCNKHLLAATDWQRDEVLGRNWFELFIPSGVDGQPEYTRAIRRGKIITRHENQIQTRYGETRLISWSSILLKDESGNATGMASIGEDITLMRQTQQAERQQRALAESLANTAALLVSSLNLDEILDSILENVGLVVAHEAANISLIEGKRAIFKRALGYGRDGTSNETVEKISVEFKLLANLRLMYETRQPLLIADTYDDPNWVRMPGTEWIGSYIGCPIVAQDKVVGFLSLDSAERGFFRAEHIERLSVFSNQAAIAINNARLYEQTQKELLKRKKAEESLRRANKDLATQLAQIESLQAQLREQVIRDPQTGLYNRRYLDETIEREISRADRDGLVISFVMIDIDRFKKVNDTYGHEAGDLLIQELADILLNDTRRADIACRFGGEEFLIIMPGAPSEIAKMRAEHWRELFAARSILYKAQKVSSTISLGVATYPTHGYSGRETIAAADQALYQAKQSGRNQVILYAKDKVENKNGGS